MRVTIQPGKAAGTVAAPPSKSMAHRLLIGAGLCSGQTSVIRGIDLSEDILATMDCLTALGAVCRAEGDVITVRGTDPRGAVPGRLLKCRESGSTLRFFVPLALLGTEKTAFEGSERLLSRPLGVYRTLCEERGLLFEQSKKGLAVQGALTAGVFTVPGDISSQFITGLLFALSLLSEDSEIRLLPPVESRSYIDLTVAALAAFGVTVRWRDACTLFVPGGQAYTAADRAVEGDYSNAAFLEAFDLLGGNVTVTGLAEESLQGDRVYRRHFESLRQGTPVISLADCPDLGPVLFALAAALNGAVFTDTRRLKIKESDRAEAMAAELRRFGASVTVEEDTVTVVPAAFHAPEEVLCGHNDHRIVMSLAVLLTKTGGTVAGAQAVRKSFPGFFEVLKQLGLEVRIDHDRE